MENKIITEEDIVKEIFKEVSNLPYRKQLIDRLELDQVIKEAIILGFEKGKEQARKFSKEK